MTWDDVKVGDVFQTVSSSLRGDDLWVVLSRSDEGTKICLSYAYVHKLGHTNAHDRFHVEPGLEIDAAYKLRSRETP